MSAHGEAATAARRNRSGELQHDLAVFVDLLRACGSNASPASSLQALRALTVIRVDRPDDFRSALECCLTASIDERAVFDAVFEPFWVQPAGTIAVELAKPGGGDGATAPGTGLGADPLGPVAVPGAAGAAGRATYSRSTRTAEPLIAQERHQITLLARRLARTLGAAPSRRSRTGGRLGTLDLPASLRHNLRFGDELIELKHSSPRRDRAQIVVLCDVSSSMRPSTPLFLAFAHALTRLARHVETAVFNVDLVMVTELFRRAPLGRSLTELHRQEGALSGGTRIGHCLRLFLDELDSRGALSRNTIALILSDGWDVGEPELLDEQLRRLSAQAARVLWCDPHAAATDFRPRVQGLRVALPYVDDYLDFSDLSALDRLVERVRNPVPRSFHPIGRTSP